MEMIKLERCQVAIDPDSGFWSIFDGKLPEDVINLWIENRDALKDELKSYRFDIGFKTTYVNPTEKCNASCPYCYIPPEIRKRGRNMSYSQLEEILNHLKDLGVEWVIFHGSEPLIVKDMIFKAIEEYEFNFGIQTNGFLLDESDVDFLIESGVNLGLSFDSPHKEVNDMLRGDGHFDAAMRVINWFKGYSKFNVITTINRYNYRHLTDMIELLAEKVGTVLMNPVRGTIKEARDLRAPPEEAAGEFIKAVERSIELTGEGRRIVIGDFANIVLGIVAPTSRVLQCDISPCGAGRRFFAVTLDGIFPCGEFIGLEEFKVSLDRIRYLEDEFSEVKARVVEEIEECKTCSYRHICGNPCPAEVYAEKGNLLEKSPYCEFYKRIIEFAFEVIARGDVDKVVRLDKMRVKYNLEA